MRRLTIPVLEVALVFVFAIGPTEGQVPGKPASPGAQRDTGDKPGAIGKYRGYFTQVPGGAAQLYYCEIDLEQAADGVGGLVRLDRIDQAGKYHIMTVKGIKVGNDVQVKDVAVIESVLPNGSPRWFTQRTFNLRLGKYAAMEGLWSDPTDKSGKGTLVLTKMEFTIIVERKKKVEGLIIGELSVNGIKLGQVYENEKKMIPAGIYPGRRRFTSTKHFVQSAGGRMEKSGDFLLEIGDVPKRTDILIHPGDKPEDSEGCLLAGPAKTIGKAVYAPDLLKELRLYFYGTNTPANPMESVYVDKEKKIKVEVRDIPQPFQDPLKRNPPDLQSPLSTKDSPKLQDPIRIPKKSAEKNQGQ